MALRFKLKVRGVFPMGTLRFFIDIILPATVWPYSPGANSFSNRNAYQVCFLGGKGGRC